jgi:hypothetical protein
MLSGWNSSVVELETVAAFEINVPTGAVEFTV